ncbi:hypothetical protein T439DRAFT_337809 [Meredithblackwellia eburnea MCA 4105]
MAAHNFQLEHWPGKLHGKADALSRQSDYAEGSKAAEGKPTTFFDQKKVRVAEITLEIKLPKPFPNVADQILAYQDQDPQIRQVLQDLRLNENLGNHVPKFLLDQAGFLLYDGAMSSLGLPPNVNAGKGPEMSAGEEEVDCITGAEFRPHVMMALSLVHNQSTIGQIYEARARCIGVNIAQYNSSNTTAPYVTNLLGSNRPDLPITEGTSTNIGNGNILINESGSQCIANYGICHIWFFAHRACDKQHFSLSKVTSPWTLNGRLNGSAVCFVCDCPKLDENGHVIPFTVAPLKLWSGPALTRWTY